MIFKVSSNPNHSVIFMIYAWPHQMPNPQETSPLSPKPPWQGAVAILISPSQDHHRCHPSLQHPSAGGLPPALYPSLMLLLPKRQFFHSVPGPLLGVFYSDLRNHHLEAKLLSWRAIWKGSPQGECNSLSLPCTPCDIWLSNVVCSMLRLQSTTIK